MEMEYLVFLGIVLLVPYLVLLALPFCITTEPTKSPRRTDWLRIIIWVFLFLVLTLLIPYPR